MIGAAPWQPSGSGPGGLYKWKVYEFDGSADLWVQVCAQCFSTSQNAVGAPDRLQMRIDGIIPNDVWGVMGGKPGLYQWEGDADWGKRITLEFRLTGLTTGRHTLKFSADETPVLWWVKVQDLQPTQ